MKTDLVGLAVVIVFAAWCVSSALSTGEWDAYMVPATIVVLLGGRFAYSLGRGR